jgi:primosomal protein N' (replication factor Y)
MALVPAKLQLVRLPERIGTRPLPPVELVDLRVADKVPATGPVPWSVRLDEAIAGALARGEQGLLLLNRRGWASFLQCPDCGEVWRCPRCSVSLTVHQHPPALRCHYCGHEQPLPYTCSACANPVHEMRGVGTQQLERLLAERFPSARIARMDLDSTSTKWSHQRILGAVERGEVDLLVGTQMIAKGLDFPNVTLVGVVNADVGLHIPDFRSAERTFQLLSQVAGRAGRGARGGRVLVQTFNPEHPSIRLAADHDYEAFVDKELAHRRTHNYPPYHRLVRLIIRSREQEAAAGFAERLAAAFQAALARLDPTEPLAAPIRVLGPAEAPVFRLKGHYRFHFQLQSTSAAALHQLLRAVLPMARPAAGVEFTVDVDPLNMQ